jgi:hypothetical protein
MPRGSELTEIEEGHGRYKIGAEPVNFEKEKNGIFRVLGLHH